MTIYKVSCAEYYKGLEQNFSFTRDRDKVKKTMIQLIDKYNIKNKSVLSVGPGTGYEEYWFNENNCQLTFIDIDETKSIEPYLKTVPDGKGLTYYIGDARQYLKEVEGKYDILYLSGFSPDEFRRGKIMDDQDKKHKIMRKIPIICRFVKIIWPKDENPFMDLVINSITSLKNNGLFISQSFYGVVNIPHNPHFIKLIQNQLKQAGIELIALYYFEKKPAVSLVIGYKGTTNQLEDYLHSIKGNPELTQFHGRSEIQSRIIKIF